MSNVDQVLQQVMSDQELPNAQIDAWIRDAQFADITQFAERLLEDWRESPRENWRSTSIYSRLIDGLAAQTEPQYAQALLDVLRHMPQARLLVRHVAAQLVWAEALDVIDGIFKTLPYSPLWPYLIHELVIEGTFSLYQHLPQVARAINEPHPLHVLPLSLLSSEEEIPNHRFGGSATLLDGHGRFGLADPASGITFDETTTPELQTRLRLPFEGWPTIEARQFTTQQPLSDDIITRTRLLLELKLAWLEGVREEMIWNVSSKQIMNTLFSAAANGGAYRHGMGNAYARLAAWTAIGALMNEHASTPIHTLNERMGKVQWFQIGTSSSWFGQIVWDEAIAALSPDRRVLTVLAATDAD